MGKNLPKGGAQLFSCAALVTVGVFAASQSARADTYTRCVQDTAPRDCIPGSGSSISLPATINLQSTGGTEGVTVFDWKVKNCNTTSGQLRGRLSIVLDNSNSATTTDPQATRATVLNQFIDEWSQTALSSGLATNDQNFPKIALTSYNGRVGVENSTTPLDDYNPSFTPSYCSQSSFPSAESVAGWNDVEFGGTTKYSRCEYLPLVPAIGGDAAVNNLKSFATYTAQQPRGSTDFTYFFKSAATTLAEAHPHGKNVLVITDGLPNIPKNVAAATCRSTPRLKYEQIVSGTPLAGAGTKEYCVDRQALTAIEQANTEALKSDYQKINFHHVLYTENQRAYFDYDENGDPRLNPARFLVENSARTGNGKVKFSYAVDEAELKSQLNKTYAQMDKNALQYVQVQVQPAGGGQTYSYNAVSPSAPGSEFSIKFIGLTTGSNTVTVTPVYQDGRSVIPQQFTVVVGGNNTAGVACSEQSADLTVDGDPRGDLTPDGDGFYHKPTQNNDFRDYRNNDPGNLLSENDFAVVGDEQSATRLRKLRLQGGTGNCGVVAHSAGQTSQAPTLLWVLLLAPLGILGVRRRRPTRSQS